MGRVKQSLKKKKKKEEDGNSKTKQKAKQMKNRLNFKSPKALILSVTWKFRDIQFITRSMAEVYCLSYNNQRNKLLNF
jgi:hypothetical protein